MQPSDSLISNLVKSLKLDQFPIHTIWKKWEELVGKQTAQNSEPVSLKEGLLTIEVTHSTWLHHLSMGKKDLLEKIQKQHPDLKIEDIRLKMKKG